MSTQTPITPSKKLFIILGAGASVDSGLPTYRGTVGLYSNSNTNPEDVLCPETLYLKPDGCKEIWKFLKPLYGLISNSQPGPTYLTLKALVEHVPDSFILTQNIDGFAKSVTDNVVEMHGNWKTMRCIKCNHISPVDLDKYYCYCGGLCRPNIVLFGETLSKDDVQLVYTNIKWNVSHVLVIGTTLQFPYLREFIGAAKSRGAKVIHINPDEGYSENVMQRETWIKMPACEGLLSLNLIS